MGVLDKIRGAIWGRAEAATPEPAAEAPAADTAAQPPAAATPAATPAAEAAAVPAGTAPAAPVAEVDVGAILDEAVKQSGQKLDWKNSIVDLMKALGLDSSLSHRKELAAELGYTGSTSDSAAMNIWLHKQVIAQLKASGGKLPDGF